jgi:hypothetical protein
MIRAGRDTIPAANTAYRNVAHQTGLLITLGGIYRADKGARWIGVRVALETRSRQIGLPMVRIGFSIVEIKDFQPGDRAHLVGLILSEWNVVLLLAGHCTSHAAGALVHIDDHAVAKFP